MSDSTIPSPSPFAAIAEVIHHHQSFALLSHIRPDGDAIGSQIALGYSLMALGKSVRLINEDGLPENLAFLQGSHLIEAPTDEPIPVEVVIALDTATQPRLGPRTLAALSQTQLWVNIDHHISNTRYGNVVLIDPHSPATGEILYNLITELQLPLPPETRDALYVAISTDTGSFQYPSTTAHTYEIGADLIRRGLPVGTINSLTYDELPYRRLELMRELLNSLELQCNGTVAHWQLLDATRIALDLRPEDSEGLIDHIRSIRGVKIAVFFEELPEGKIRISMRSKDPAIDVCAIATQFGGGGHTLAAGIRMPGPIHTAKQKVLSAIEQHIHLAYPSL